MDECPCVKLASAQHGRGQSHGHEAVARAGGVDHRAGLRRHLAACVPADQRRAAATKGQHHVLHPFRQQRLDTAKRLGLAFVDEDHVDQRPEPAEIRLQG